MKIETISLVVPFFNEEEVVALFFERVVPILRSLQPMDYQIVCVNDGSRDRTLDALVAQAHRDDRLTIVDLSRNFGKEAALTAGLQYAAGTIVVPLDADLQDPPELIPLMISKWRDGFDVVIARRSNRASDTAAKRHSASWFYKVHNALADIQIPENAGDFRLMSKRVVDALNELPENRRFMKGLFAWIGFKTTSVEYQREARVGGKTKFSAWKLWNLALEGITSFSTLPLRVWFYVGLLTATFALLYGLALLIRTLVQGIDLPGYASTIVAVLFLGGVQLIGIGIIGEYVGRMYFEAKRRPVYVVSKIFNNRLGNEEGSTNATAKHAASHGVDAGFDAP